MTNTPASIVGRTLNSPAAGLAPSDQRLQREDPGQSHDQIERSLNQHRPARDEWRQACDEHRPNGDKEQDQRDSGKFAGRGRHDALLVQNAYKRSAGGKAGASVFSFQLIVVTCGGCRRPGRSRASRRCSGTTGRPACCSRARHRRRRRTGRNPHSGRCWPGRSLERCHWHAARRE